MSDCTDIRKRIRRGETEGVAAHLAACPSCTEFADAFHFLGDLENEPDAAPMDFDRAFVDLENKLAAQSKIRKTLAEKPTWVRLIAVAFFTLAAALLVWLFMRRVDWHQYPMLRFLPEAAAMLLAAGASLFAVLRPLHRPPRTKLQVIGLAATTAAVLLAPLLLPPAHTNNPESLKGVGDDLVHRAIACFRWGIAMGCILGVPAFFASRGARGFTALPVLFFAAMGLFAQLALHLHCPIVHPLHIGLGHTAIVPALLAVYGLGRLWARRRGGG